MKKKKHINMWVKWATINIMNIEIGCFVGQESELDGAIASECTQSIYEQYKEIIVKDPISEKQLGGNIRFKGGGSIIWLKEWNLSVLVHEIIHAVFYAATTKGLTLSGDSEEFYTYASEFLFKEFTQNIPKKFK